jgi:hypothetical protein
VSAIIAGPQRPFAPPYTMARVRTSRSPIAAARFAASAAARRGKTPFGSLARAGSASAFHDSGRRSVVRGRAAPSRLRRSPLRKRAPARLLERRRRPRSMIGDAALLWRPCTRRRPRCSNG